MSTAARVLRFLRRVPYQRRQAVSACPFVFWTMLPLELRRRLRVLPVHQIGLMGVNDTRVPAHPMDVLASRIAHLRDVPPVCCKEHQ